MEETAQLIPIQFDRVMQSRAYTCVVLGNEEKKFGIYTEASTGKAMEGYLTQSEKQRPLTHDLLNMIFRGFEIKVKHIVVNQLEDTIYFSRIFLEQTVGEEVHIVEIDARPSDCITLALSHKCPVYCTQEVYDAAVALEE